MIFNENSAWAPEGIGEGGGGGGGNKHICLWQMCAWAPSIRWW